MGALEDLRQWLKEIPLWQELGKVPDRMAALEKRVADLEDRLKVRPGETCPKCGEHTVRLSEVGTRRGSMGKEIRYDTYECASPGCDFREQRAVHI